MATIAEMLGAKAQPLQTIVSEQERKNRLRLHAVAAGRVEGCPLKRDSNGRLRAAGKFVSVR